jgi:hypothetical protein
MEGIYLKQFLVAHSNINMSDCSFLYDNFEKWNKLSTDEQIEFLSEMQIKHAETVIEKLK